MSADLIRYSDLDLRHFRLILAVAEAGNLTAAARRLRLTTSALSHQLRQLEDIANTRVFSRDSKSMHPTRAGEMLVQTAERVLEIVYDAEEQLRSDRSLQGELIRLCAHCYTGYQWLPAVLREFQQTHDQAEIRIVPDETHRPFAALTEKRLDLVLSFDPPAGNETTAQLLFRDELFLLVSRNHRLARQRAVNLAELNQEHLILYYQNVKESYFIRQHLLPAGIRPKRVTGITLTEGIMEMVRANLGVTVLAGWAVRSANCEGVMAKRITGRGLRRNWYAVTREKPSPGSALAALIDKIREHMQRSFGSRSKRPARSRPR